MKKTVFKNEDKLLLSNVKIIVGIDDCFYIPLYLNKHLRSVMPDVEMLFFYDKYDPSAIFLAIENRGFKFGYVAREMCHIIKRLLRVVPAGSYFKIKDMNTVHDKMDSRSYVLADLYVKK